MLHCEARRPARRAADGSFVPLKQQDPRLWLREMIVEAESELITAARAKVFGRFQCEAAIQSVHAQSPLTGRTQHEALATLYGLLARYCPSVGVLVAQAAAMVEAGDHGQALEMLARLVPVDVARYQPYGVTLANAQSATGLNEEAAQSMQTAIGLTEDLAVRRFLAGLGNEMR